MCDHLASFSYTGVGAEGGVGALPMTPPLGLFTCCSLFSADPFSNLDCSWCVGRWLTWLAWDGGGDTIDFVDDVDDVDDGGPLPFIVGPEYWVKEDRVPGIGRI